MSTFTASFEIAGTKDGPFKSVIALVDTGAYYTWLPRKLLDELGLQPTRRQRFVVADGRTLLKEMTEVVIKINGDTQHTMCVFGDEGSLALLGAVTLEEFALGVDPVHKKLIPIEEPLPMTGFYPS